jgi:hypothetical protein
MTYEMKPWNAELYAKDLALFLGPVVPGLTEPIVTVEYIKALNDAMHSSRGYAANMSINGIDHMAPDVASYAKYGDFREFVPAVQHEYVVTEIIGVHHHHVWV